jgi:CrcB protein
MARYWLTSAMVGLTGPNFPWGTLLINVSGSFVIGLFAALTGTAGRFDVPLEARAFVMAGLCGGFTTFSAFSLQTFALFRDGRWLTAGGYAALSVLLCVVGVMLGYAVAAALGSRSAA